MDRYTKDGFALTTAAMTDRLTAVVDDLEKNRLAKFKDWATPGKNLSAATLDLARTVCRRAERRVVALGEENKKLNPEVIRYLNRLADLLWLMARKEES